MYKLFGMKRRYFGYYPFVNILVTNLVFRTLKYRAFRLKLYWRFKKKDIPEINLVNDASTAQKFQQLYRQGFDKLNVGGGSKNFKGFINLDFVSHSIVEREVVANILDLTFIPDASCSHIHSNHLIEHITQEQLEKHLKDCYRILKADGVLSLRCPNALGVSYGFFFEVAGEKNHDEFLALGYPPEEDFYNPLDGWYHKDLYGFYHWINAYTGNRENEHLNIITPTKLKKTVKNAGFQILKMTDPETSNIVVMAGKIKN
jgi:SAM-dependent methyltransferase